MLGFGLFFVTLWAALSGWALICGLLTWWLGFDTTTQLGLGPVVTRWPLREKLQLQLGALPLGAWVQVEPVADTVMWIGIGVHAALAAVSALGLALSAGWPAGATDWLATVLRFGHPPTGGVLRTVWAQSGWIAAQPAASVALIVCVLAIANGILGTLQRLAGERVALQALVAFGPLPWLLWLLWLDLLG